MELTPDLRHHLEVQYLASRGVLCEVMDEWMRNPLLDDTIFHERMSYPGVTVTFLNYAFSWVKSEKEYGYWDSINQKFCNLIWGIQDGTDT